MATKHRPRRRSVSGRRLGLGLGILSAALIGSGLSACSSGGGGNDRAAMAAAEARWGGAPGHPAGVGARHEKAVEPLPLQFGAQGLEARSAVAAGGVVDESLEFRFEHRLKLIAGLSRGNACRFDFPGVAKVGQGTPLRNTSVAQPSISRRSARKNPWAR